MYTQTRSWFGLLGTFAVLSGFIIGGGVPGLLVGGLVAASWWVLPAMYAFVLGHFGLLLLASNGSGLGVIVGLEIGLIALLLHSTVSPPRPGQVLALSIGAIGSATVLGWASYAWLGSIVGVGGLVLGVGAILAYWIRRYEQVALDYSRETTDE